jgi:hypothetical protein
MSPISSRLAVCLASFNLAHAWILHQPLHQVRHVAYRAQSTIPSSTFAFQSKDNIQQSKRYLFGGLFSSSAEFAAKDKILDAMDEKNTIVLDVRSMDEINANGKVNTKLKWFQSNCTPMSCPDLASQAKTDFPDKDGRFIQILVLICISPNYVLIILFVLSRFNFSHHCHSLRLWKAGLQGSGNFGE